MMIKFEKPGFSKQVRVLLGLALGAAVLLPGGLCAQTTPTLSTEQTTTTTAATTQSQTVQGPAKLTPVLKAPAAKAALTPVLKTKDTPEAKPPEEEAVKTAVLTPSFKGPKPAPKAAKPEPVKVATITKPEPSPTPQPEAIKPEKPAPAPEPVKVAAQKPQPKPAAEPAPAGKQTVEEVILAALAKPASDQTRSELIQLAAQYSDSVYVGDLMMRVGEVSLELGQFAQAASSFSAVRDQAQSQDLVFRARRGLARIKLFEKNYSELDSELATLIKDFPEPAWRSGLPAQQAMAQMAQGQPADPALMDQFKAQAQPPAPVLLCMAISDELSGRTAQARRNLEKLTAQYPASPEAGLAQVRLNDLKRPLLEPMLP